MRINEGGNVFKDAQGQPLTQRIQKADVPATIQWLEQLTGLDLTGKESDEEGVSTSWLGSTGRRTDSGDVDLVVTGVTKDQLYQTLLAWLNRQGLDPREWIKKAGELHFRTPIAGDPQRGYVQTDFNFYASPEATAWAKFYMSGSSQNYKGMHRNVLLSSLAKSLNLKVGGNGMLNRADNELVKGGQDPDVVAKTLLGPGHTRADLRSVESIYRALDKDPRRDAKLADFRGYLEREGLQEPDTPMSESDVNFMARLRDRIVNMGMQVIIEAEEKKDPRIPHPEDAVFLQGSAGAGQAIADLEGAVKNAGATTIKWDGKPALVWGRLPNGRLAVMDKYMFDAGFAAQSPADWQRYDQQKASGRLRGDLYPKIEAIWPGLDAATRGSGFYWGDLMWAGRLEPQQGEYRFRPNTVEYSVPVNSQLGRTIGDKTGGVVVHQKFANLGDKKAQVWDGTGLENVPGGVDIIRPNVGINFRLQMPAAQIKNAKAAVSKYGKAVDQLLNTLPTSTRERIQTYFNQRVTGGTQESLHSWLQKNISAKQYRALVTGTPNEQGQYDARTQNLPGALYMLDKQNQPQPSPAYTGLMQIWDSIYQAKLNMAQQLESQVQGLKQSTAGRPEGEGFVIPTPRGLVKLVNRGVFSAQNVQQNNPR
jgi:hypothetical protein